jgi:hypothetical protein
MHLYPKIMAPGEHTTMLKNDTVNNEQIPSMSTAQRRPVDIPNALPMRLQMLDLVRHTVIAPDGKRFVVATYHDKYIGRGYVTGVYPQQNDYLTLIRLTVREYISGTSDDAIKRHISVVQAIQQGRVGELP